MDANSKRCFVPGFLLSPATNVLWSPCEEDEKVKSFNKFLKVNFPTQKNTSERTKSYLEAILREFSGTELHLMADTKKNKQILENWEESGLRKEVWLFNDEDYTPDYLNLKPEDTLKLDFIDFIDDDEIVPITNRDTLNNYKKPDESKWLHSNTYGMYLYGLKEFAPNDALVQEYVDIKTLVGDISPSIMARAYLISNQDLSEPFIQRMIIVEFYYYFMRWDVENQANEKRLMTY